MNSINQYLHANKLHDKHLMPGIMFFGWVNVAELCKQALKNNQRIEFYYKDDLDLRIDKLSYRFC